MALIRGWVVCLTVVPWVVDAPVMEDAALRTDRAVDAPPEITAGTGGARGVCPPLAGAASRRVSCRSCFDIHCWGKLALITGA